MCDRSRGQCQRKSPGESTTMQRVPMQGVLSSDLIFAFSLVAQTPFSRPPEVLAEELLQILKGSG